MKFCDNLRFLIDERNLTQKQVAMDLHVAPSTMGGYVQGSSEPDFETLKRLAAYFDVTTDYLLSGISKNDDRNYEEELLCLFRCMSDEHKRMFIEQGKVFVQK